MRNLQVAAACVPVFASVALAQTSMETKWHCPKSTAVEKYEVGDPGGHAYAIEQGTCNAVTSNAGEKSGAFTESLEWARPRLLPMAA